METKAEILAFIISEVRSFLDSGKSNATLGKLSSKTGIPKTTICRYAQNEVTSEPTSDIAFSFLSFFKGPSEAAKIMCKPYEKWWEHTGQFIGDNSKLLSTDDSFSFTPVHVKIMYKAEMPGGVSNEWIINNFGTQIGIVAKNELLQLEFLVERNGVNYPCTERLIETNMHSLHSLMKAELECYPLEQAGHKALLWHVMEPVSVETRKKIRARIVDFVYEIRQIKEDGKLSGEPRNELFKLNMFGDWAEEPEDR